MSSTRSTKILIATFLFFLVSPFGLTRAQAANQASYTCKLPGAVLHFQEVVAGVSTLWITDPANHLLAPNQLVQNANSVYFTFQKAADPAFYVNLYDYAQATPVFVDEVKFSFKDVVSELPQTTQVSLSGNFIFNQFDGSSYFPCSRGAIQTQP
jgi:hypothetical protein